MPIPFGWDGTDDSTQDFNPFAGKYIDPPTPRVYSYDSGYRRGGRGGIFDQVWSTRNNRRPPSDDDDDDLNNKIGYETDWEYPSWLIRMAQWRNF